MKKTKLIAIVATGFTASLLSVHAQQLLRTEYSVDAKLVLVPVTVTDRNGAFINGLPRNAFSISEDGVGQPIRSFSEDEAPVSIGIVLDTSGSMKSVLGVARESLHSFVALSNPDDEAFLTTVSTHPRVWSGFTDNLDGLLSNVSYERAVGSTALIDTVWVSLDQLRGAKNARKALLIVSDGVDNHSRHTRGELLERASEADVQIYTLSVNDPPPNTKGVELVEEQHGMQLMQDLSARTGGLQFLVRSRSDIDQATAGVSRALRNQYNIGYTPGNGDRTGKWRRIQVKVARSGLKAHTRTGYRLD
jgi:Ca-activated chloride channel family protein